MKIFLFTLFLLLQLTSCDYGASSTQKPAERVFEQPQNIDPALFSADCKQYRASISTIESKQLGAFICDMKPNKDFINVYGRAIKIPSAWREYAWISRSACCCNIEYFNIKRVILGAREAFTPIDTLQCWVNLINYNNRWTKPMLAFDTTADTVCVGIFPKGVYMQDMTLKDTSLCVDYYFLYPQY